MSMAIISCTETSSTTLSSQTTESTTTVLPLDVPTNFAVNDNLVSFDLVDGANKYKVKVETTGGTLVGEYNVSNNFNLLYVLQVGVYMISIKAVGSNNNDSLYSTPIEVTISDPNQISTLSETSLSNASLIRWMGRNYYDELNQRNYFYFTASGFEVAFYGTSLTATFFSTNYNVVGKQAYLVAFVDGDDSPTHGTTFILNEQNKEITLVSGLEYGYHTVKVLKRSEASDSDTALSNLSTDGYFTNAPLGKDFKIQFIAASSSTGYGNLGSLSVPKSTDNSDGLQAFAFLTSYMLDADVSIFSASGWGATRGWNTGGAVSQTQTIPEAFQYIAINSSNTVFTSGGKWDMSNYVPDVIVVNLGTNDFNANNYSSLSEELQKVQSDLFIDTYTYFLRVLNNSYPDAIIIVAYGLMGEQNVLGGFTLQVIANANEAIGSSVVYPFIMEAAGSGGNPYGSNYHPNVQTSINVAEDLSALITSLTGKESVNAFPGE